jgi:hypothetical protein
MRFYDITITDPANPNNKQVYSSWINGQNDPGALNVLFDFNVVPYSSVSSASMVEIWGIPLKSISFATNLNNKNVSISAGFKPGLPLATVAARNQTGPIVSGFIVQSYGNWIGTNMTLNLMIIAGQAPGTQQAAATSAQQATAAATTASSPVGSPQNPANFSFSMPVGVSLKTAIQNTLAAALPSYAAPTIKIRDIVASGPRNFVARSLPEFSQRIKALSQQIVGGSYSGVEIAAMPAGNALRVYDINTKETPINIAFNDLIGQPTWIAPQMIQFKCPMRADLQVGYFVKMPEKAFYGVQPNNPATPVSYRFQSVQKGKFLITGLRHVGNFRQPDASSWVTVVTCAFIPST